MVCVVVLLQVNVCECFSEDFCSRAYSACLRGQNDRERVLICVTWTWLRTQMASPPWGFRRLSGCGSKRKNMRKRRRFELGGYVEVDFRWDFLEMF